MKSFLAVFPILMAASLLSGCAGPGAGRAPAPKLAISLPSQGAGWVVYPDADSPSVPLSVSVIRSDTKEVLYQADLSAPPNGVPLTWNPETSADQAFAEAAPQPKPPPPPLQVESASTAGPTVSRVRRGEVTISGGADFKPKPGSQWYVCTPAQTITHPLTGETQMLSKGEVIGLVEIESSEPGQARARLLSGEARKKCRLEASK